MSRSGVMRWRASWGLAQVTGVLFSTVVWIVLVALAPAAVAAAGLWAAVVVVGRCTSFVLWARYGARRTTPAQRQLILRALVPVVSLRERGQPQLSVGRYLRGGDVFAPAPGHLVVTPRVVRWLEIGELSGDQFCGLVRRALARLPVDGSRLVLATELYCAPWRVVRVVGAVLRPRGVIGAVVKLSWQLRPVVFVVAVVQSWVEGRWLMAVAVAALLLLSYAAGVLDRRWARALARLTATGEAVAGSAPELSSRQGMRHGSTATAGRPGARP